MPPNGWLISIETIREAFETDVFKLPGKVAKLANRNVHEVQQQGVRLGGTSGACRGHGELQEIDRSGGEGEHRGDDAHPGGQ